MIAGGGKVIFLRDESVSKWHLIFATYSHFLGPMRRTATYLKRYLLLNVGSSNKIILFIS